MIHRFNDETLDLVAVVEGKVAGRLGVDSTTLCIATGPNNDGAGDSFCFETDEDDTYAALDLGCVSKYDIKDILEDFMSNQSVVWMKKGIEIKHECDRYAYPVYLTNTELSVLKRMIKERL